MNKLYAAICLLTLLPINSFASEGDCASISGVVPNGGSICGYTSPVSMPSQPFSSLVSTVSCMNGSLLGPDIYPSCVDTSDIVDM